MELTPISPIEIFFWDSLPLVANVWSWLVYVFAIILCVSGFRNTKKKGYLAILIFFLHPAFFWGFREVRYQIHKDEYEAIRVQKQKELDEMIERGEIPISEQKTNFPIFDTFLVLGLFYVTRKETKIVNQSCHTTPASASR